MKRGGVGLQQFRESRMVITVAIAYDRHAIIRGQATYFQNRNPAVLEVGITDKPAGLRARCKVAILSSYHARPLDETIPLPVQGIAGLVHQFSRTDPSIPNKPAQGGPVVRKWPALRLTKKTGHDIFQNHLCLGIARALCTHPAANPVL